MTNPRPSSRRVRWATLLAVAGVALGGAYAVHRRRWRPPVEPVEPAPAAEPAPVPVPDEPVVSPPRVRPAFILALLLVLALAAVTAIRLWDTEPTALPNRPPRAEPPVTSSTAVPSILDVKPWRLAPTRAPEPSAAVVPDSLHADDMPCTPGTARPVLDTVRPVLTARLTAPAPLEMQLEKEDAAGFVPFDSGDLTATGDGYVTLYLRRDYRLGRGESYRWRIRTAAAGEWSPWCAFRIATTTPDSLNIEDVSRTVVLPPSQWQRISAVLDDPPRFWPIFQAARKQTGDTPIEMRTADWEIVIASIAERASVIDDAVLWQLADALSGQVGGPPHPTMGFPRA